MAPLPHDFVMYRFVISRGQIIYTARHSKRICTCAVEHEHTQSILLFDVFICWATARFQCGLHKLGPIMMWNTLQISASKEHCFMCTVILSAKHMVILNHEYIW